jgi:hypothetical protein
VLTHRCEWQRNAFIAAHNLSSSPVKTSIPFEAGEQLVELAGDRPCSEVRDPAHIELEGYGYRWYHVQGKDWDPI